MPLSRASRPASAIVIIGAGLAGYTLVREIRKLDRETPIKVITADSGAYYSKPQLSTALAHQKTPEQLVLYSPEKFAAQQNIILDNFTPLSALDALSYGQLVLACGSQPAYSDNYLHINHLDDYKAFYAQLNISDHRKKRPVIILGAGLVACELANDLLEACHPVMIIAPDDYPLAGFIPPLAGRYFQEAFHEKGAFWALNTPVDKIAGKIAALKDQHPEALILSATGLKPASALALQAGIALSTKPSARGAILVDSYLQTSQSHVYALGDCAAVNHQWLPYIASLTLGARALARTLLGEPAAVHYPPMPVYIKTSIYPVVSLWPPENLVNESRWKIEEIRNPEAKSLPGVRALFYSAKGSLAGFSLAGCAASEASHWGKQIVSKF